MVMVTSGVAWGQCIDSTQIRPFYTGCDRTNYHPVCACGTTYFNECIATMEFGVRPGTYTDEVCNTFDYAFFPNPMAAGSGVQINFFIQFKKPEYNLAYLYIMDMYGTNLFNRIIQTPFNNYHFLLEESAGFKTGVYLMYVVSEGIIKVQKLVVIQVE